MVKAQGLTTYGHKVTLVKYMNHKDQIFAVPNAYLKLFVQYAMTAGLDLTPCWKAAA